jgi:hypothetical protein
MQAHKSRFNRVLLIVLAALYVLTLGAFVYFNRSRAGLRSEMPLLNLLILSILLVLPRLIYVLILAK